MELGFRKKFDIEWVKLIREAKSLGLTTEEVRRFLAEFNDDSDS